MANLIRKLSSFHKNGIISMKELRTKSPYLFRYVKSNGSAALFEETGIQIMNDLSSCKDIIPLFLRYHYGDIVNLTNLRNKHITVYRHICKLGKPIEYVESLGFKVEFESKLTETQLIEELEKRVDSRGYLQSLTKTIHNSLSYRASQNSMTVAEYLKLLGFKRR